MSQFREFDQAKAKILDGLADPSPDNSKKGGVDAPIVDLLEFINANPRYVSTSSCSGRVAVYSEADAARKQTGEWLFVSHDPVDAAGIETVVLAVAGGSKKHPGAGVLFKFEPFVLHVSCRSLEDGQLMLKTALAAGYKNSGMIVGRRTMVNVRGTLKLEVPVVYNGEMVVSEDYIRLLVKISNEKMKENVARIDRFEATFKAAINGAAPRDEEEHGGGDTSNIRGGSGLAAGAGGNEADTSGAGAARIEIGTDRVVAAVYGERLHKRKREWLIEWADTRDPDAPRLLPLAAAAVDGLDPKAAAAAAAAAEKEAAVKSWESFGAVGLQAPLIAFEEKRTGLQDTLNIWNAPPANPEAAAGTIVDTDDGHRVYYCLQNDSVKSVAAANGLLLQQLYEQNSGRYGMAKFKLTSKLPALAQLRLPKLLPVSSLTLAE